VARIRESQWLADHGAVAAIDISDGLAADLEHLARASGVGVEVDLSRVPLFPGVTDQLLAAASGEEYEIIAAADEDMPTEEFEREFGIPLTPIGRATDAGQDVLFRLGSERVAKPRGYDHFSQ
jgi:thiamine-monophosphate kinase